MIITYLITSDYEGKLRESARLACSFWNHFIVPSKPAVIRLGTFSSFGVTIARAYRPYQRDGISYGVVEFNRKYLKKYDSYGIAGTIIHEIGHTLGMGWDQWTSLFDATTGKFHQHAIQQVPALANMLVETDYGPGTTLSHWDEEVFDKELMTGFKDKAETVKPVTFEVMSLLGHHVEETVTDLKPDNLLVDIIKLVSDVEFSQSSAVAAINRDVFVSTEIYEEVYAFSRTRVPEI